MPTQGSWRPLVMMSVSSLLVVTVWRGVMIDEVGLTAKLEGTNARDLDAETIPEPIELLVSDVSFVSVVKVLEAPLALCTPTADAVILFKPQFEVGRSNVGKGGIVTSEAAIAVARDEVIAFVEAQGFALKHAVPSPISGGDGNEETVLVFGRRA